MRHHRLLLVTDNFCYYTSYHDSEFTSHCTN